ncbi:jg10519, partial [Pararge aegeria aegeria]
ITFVHGILGLEEDLGSDDYWNDHGEDFKLYGSKKRSDGASFETELRLRRRLEFSFKSKLKKILLDKQKGDDKRNWEV